MKVLIRPVSDVKLTIDGQELPGTFTLVSEWEGFAKFMCAEPPGFVVVGDARRVADGGDLIDFFSSFMRPGSALTEMGKGVQAVVLRMSAGIHNKVNEKRVAEPVEPNEPVMEPAAAVPADPGAAGFSPAGGFDEPVMVGGRKRVG